MILNQVDLICTFTKNSDEIFIPEEQDDRLKSHAIFITCLTSLLYVISVRLVYCIS